MNVEEIISLLVSILSFIISFLALLISKNQFKYAKKIDLFERRFKIYTNVYNILHIPKREGEIEIQKLLEFRKDVEISKLLFNKEIYLFLLEVKDKLWEYHVVTSQLEENSKERLDLELWFGKKIEETDIQSEKSKFLRYINLR